MVQYMFPKYVKALNEGIVFLTSKQDTKGIVVFDIDDTLLLPSSGIGIPESVFFYRFVKCMGFKTVIITARMGYKENIDKTFMDLKNIGIKDFESIYFRSTSNPDVAKFKLSSRKNIHDRYNENVIMSVGDMPWDLGEYGGVGVFLER